MSKHPARDTREWWAEFRVVIRSDAVDWQEWARARSRADDRSDPASDGGPGADTDAGAVEAVADD